MSQASCLDLGPDFQNWRWCSNHKLLPDAKRSVLRSVAIDVIQLSSGIHSSELLSGLLWAFGTVHNGFFFEALHRASELLMKWSFLSKFNSNHWYLNKLERSAWTYPLSAPETMTSSLIKCTQSNDPLKHRMERKRFNNSHHHYQYQSSFHLGNKTATNSH